MASLASALPGAGASAGQTGGEAKSKLSTLSEHPTELHSTVLASVWSGSSSELKQHQDKIKTLGRIDAARRQLEQDRAQITSIFHSPGAAHGGKVWHVVRLIFHQTRSNLEYMRLTSASPPPKWQSNCFNRLQNQLGTVLFGRTDDVRHVLAERFASVGWDCHKKGPKAGAQPPTLVQMISFLDDSVRFCRRKELDRKKQILREIHPTEDELHNLSEACSRLWDLDANRLVPGKDYEIDLQRSTNRQDRAPNPLFVFVDPSKLELPTFQHFMSLIGNYQWEPGVEETVTAEELREDAMFIDLCMHTAPMIYCYKYLVATGNFHGSKEDFAHHLRHLWFDGYSRGRGRHHGNDSSPFEHVFVGEGKRDRETGKISIIGMHNWIGWYEQEKAGRFDYYGFKKPQGRRPRSLATYAEEQILSIVFTWHGKLKPVSTGFIGVSPEFELALYTMCFMAGKEDNPVEVGPYSISVECFRFHGNKIGSTHPRILSTNMDEAATQLQSVVRGRQSRQRHLQQHGHSKNHHDHGRGAGRHPHCGKTH